MGDFALKFIAGPLQGREFILESDQEVIIGRSDEANLRIIEDTISRKHARIHFRNDEIVIEDLSRNGTYVNSRRIEKAVLMPGDLIYIGATVLRVCLTTAVPLPAMPVLQTVGASATPEPALRLDQTVLTGPAPARPRVPSSTSEWFRGAISEIALPDLLQLLSSSRKTGVLTLRSADIIGKIYLEKGAIRYATMDEMTPINPKKVFHRLMRWTDGRFEFTPPENLIFPVRIEESTDHLLLESMHELDEINNLGPDLPSLHAEVEIANPLPSPLKDLAAGDLDFIQLAMRHKLVRDILDHYSGSDFEGYTYLKSLLGRKFLVVTL